MSADRPFLADPMTQEDIDADMFRYEKDDDDDPERWGTCGSCGAVIDVKDDLADGCWYCGEEL